MAGPDSNENLLFREKIIARTVFRNRRVADTAGKGDPIRKFPF